MFQSTPPARGATSGGAHPSGDMQVSIHAPCAGGDRQARGVKGQTGSFNPRPLRGGRPMPTTNVVAQAGFNPRPLRGGRLTVIIRHAAIYMFQSTPPARGATYAKGQNPRLSAVSIHAPCAGGDPGGGVLHPSGRGFNPRPLRGGRLDLSDAGQVALWFQSTPPARGATSCSTHRQGITWFQSTPPARGATRYDKES